MAEAHGIGIEARPSAARVEADADRLVQVVVNLLSNAVKFSPSGAVVTLEAEAREGHAEVRVRDRGRGVPERLQRAIFERFKQVEASDSRDKGGTGLGLAICKAIVEQHHGEIGVRSTEGEGSTFWFRCPWRASSRRPPTVPRRPGDPLLSSLRDGFGARAPGDVIVADGDEAMLGVLARQLLARGSWFARQAPARRRSASRARSRPAFSCSTPAPGPDGFAVVGHCAGSRSGGAPAPRVLRPRPRSRRAREAQARRPLPHQVPRQRRPFRVSVHELLGAPRREARMKVLIIDDEDDIRRIARLSLARVAGWA